MARKKQSAKKLLKKNNTRTLYNSKKRRKSRNIRKKKGGSEYTFNDLMNDKKEEIYKFFLDSENKGTFKEVAEQYLKENYTSHEEDELYAFLTALLDKIIYDPVTKEDMGNYDNFKKKFFPDNIDQYIDNYRYRLDSQLKKYDPKKLLKEKKLNWNIPQKKVN